MKRLLLLLLAVILFNCSEDDSNDNSLSDDPIVGEWIGYRHFQIEDNEWVSFDLDDDLSAYTDKRIFNSDGTFLLQEFYEGELEYEDEGLWERISDNEVKLTNNEFSMSFPMTTFCSDNILKINAELGELVAINYVRKSTYNPNNCDEVTYPNE